MPTRFKVLLASAVLFTVSLVLPAVRFTTTHGAETMPVVGMWVFGWFDLFAGVWCWLANPLLALAWLLLVLKKRVAAVALSSASLALAVSSVQLFGVGVMKDESGARYPVERLGPGFYVWCVAIGVAPAGALLSREKPAVTT